MKQRSSCFPPTAVGPFWSNAAIIVHHANVDTLALPAELLRSVDREDHCLLTAAVWTQSVGFVIDHPRVVVSHNIVPRIRHDLLPTVKTSM